MAAVRIQSGMPTTHSKANLLSPDARNAALPMARGRCHAVTPPETNYKIGKTFRTVGIFATIFQNLSWGLRQEIKLGIDKMLRRLRYS